MKTNIFARGGNQRNPRGVIIQHTTDYTSYLHDTIRCTILLVEWFYYFIYNNSEVYWSI